MKQIALDIGLAPEPTLDGYLPGRNTEALQHLRLRIDDIGERDLAVVVTVQEAREQEGRCCILRQ